MDYVGKHLDDHIARLMTREVIERVVRRRRWDEAVAKASHRWRLDSVRLSPAAMDEDLIKFELTEMVTRLVDRRLNDAFIGLLALELSANMLTVRVSLAKNKHTCKRRFT